MTRLSLDLAALERALAAIAGGAKAYNPDQPRAANGEWGSGGAHADDDHADDADDGEDDEEEYGPGEGYAPEDQEAHDAAEAALLGDVARLQVTLDRVSLVFHDDQATVAQLAEAAQAVMTRVDAAGATLDRVNGFRDAYGDEHREIPILDDSIALRDAAERLQDALGAVRTETEARARLVAQHQAEDL